MDDQTDNVRAFVAAMAASPVVAGRAHQRGGGWYRLQDGRKFELSLAEARSVGVPIRWSFDA